MKESEIQKWLGLIKLSLLEREAKQPNWEKYLSYFRGLMWDEAKSENKDVITVNLIYSQVKVEIPSIYFRNPKLFMKATKPSAVYRAKIQETVLNQDIEVMDFKTEMRKILLDVILLGTSFAKTTYYIDYDEKELEPGDKGQILSLVQRFQGGPIASAEDEEIEIGKNGPMVTRTSPFNVAFRVGAHDIRDPGFIAIRSRLYIEDVKNDPYFKNTEDLQPNVTLTDEMKAKLRGFWGNGVDEAVEMIDCWEVWDPNKERKFVIAEGHNKALVEPEEHPYPYDHPLDLLKFTDIPDEMWGMSEIEPAIPQIDELNKHRTLLLMHTKKYAARKILARRGTINDEEQRADLTSGEDAIVEIDGNPSADILGLQDTPITPDVYKFMGILKDDIVEIVGITPYKRGLTGGGADTATEASIVENNSGLRDQDRMDLISTFAKKILRKVRLCRKEFTPGEYIVQVTGDPKAGPLWEVWGAETFTEDVILDIAYGSTAPQNAQTRVANAQTLYDRLIQNPTINPQAAAAKLLEAYDETDFTSWFLPPAIIQQQLMQKMMGEQEEQQKGVAPGPNTGSAPATPRQETPAELGGNPLRAIPGAGGIR